VMLHLTYFDADAHLVETGLLTHFAQGTLGPDSKRWTCWQPSRAGARHDRATVRKSDASRAGARHDRAMASRTAR
jgi:hypothetical protein